MSQFAVQLICIFPKISEFSTVIKNLSFQGSFKIFGEIREILKFARLILFFFQFFALNTWAETTILECENGYLEWYLIVSHPHIIPSVEHIDDVGYSDARVLVDDVPPPLPVDADDQHLLPV